MRSGRSNDASPAGTPAWLTGRAEWIAVGSLVVLALVLRIVYVFGMRESPAFDGPTMDPKYHVDWARAVAAGNTFHPGPFFRAPLYPWFLGGLFRLFGEDLLVARLIQAGLGAASTLLVYLLGRVTFDRRVAWWAAVAAATYWVSIYFDGELLIPTLAIPLNLLALLFSARQARDPKPRNALGAGLAWGLSAIARPNVLLFLPPLAIWFWLGAGSNRRRGLRHALLLSTAALVPILPLTVYNWTIGNDRALISTQAGVNLWIGNNPSADGSTAIAPGTRASWWGGYQDTIAQAEAREGRSLRPSEVSRHYTRRATDFIVSHPDQSIPLLLRKLRMFWMDWELANNQEIRFFAFRFNPWLRFTPLRFSLLAAAGLLGIVLSWKQRRSTFPLWGFLLVYTLSVVAFFINGRYRLPVVPILMLYTSYTLVWMFDSLRSRRFLPVAGGLAWIVAGCLASQARPAGLSTDDSNGLWQLGVAEEMRANRADEQRDVEALHRHLVAAEHHFEESLRVKPKHAFARIALARVLARQARPAEAIVELEACIPGPSELNAIEPLLDLYIAEGQVARALSAADAILERRPNLATAHYARGRVLAQNRDWQGAKEAMARAESADPRDPRYPFGSALVRANLSDSEGCLAALGRAARVLDVDNPAHHKLGEQVFDNALRLLGEGDDEQALRGWMQQRERWHAGLALQR